MDEIIEKFYVSNELLCSNFFMKLSCDILNYDSAIGASECILNGANANYIVNEFYYNGNCNYHHNIISILVRIAPILKSSYSTIPSETTKNKYKKLKKLLGKLLQIPSINIDIRGENENVCRTPLMYALEYCEYDIVKMLIKAGANHRLIFENSNGDFLDSFVFARRNHSDREMESKFRILLGVK